MDALYKAIILLGASFGGRHFGQMAGRGGHLFWVGNKI
jgi:hypothetical protein